MKSECHVVQIFQERVIAFGRNDLKDDVYDILTNGQSYWNPGISQNFSLKRQTNGLIRLVVE
jgi:hypothetical protein